MLASFFLPLDPFIFSRLLTCLQLYICLYPTLLFSQAENPDVLESEIAALATETLNSVVAAKKPAIIVLDGFQVRKGEGEREEHVQLFFFSLFTHSHSLSLSLSLLIFPFYTLFRSPFPLGPAAAASIDPHIMAARAIQGLAAHHHFDEYEKGERKRREGKRKVVGESVPACSRVPSCSSSCLGNCFVIFHIAGYLLFCYFLNFF